MANDTKEGQRSERLARMSLLAGEVWENAELAQECLTSSQPQLGQEAPVEKAASDSATREVEQLLLRLEWSLPV